MKRLSVWILQTGEPLHIDADNPRPMRAMNLANALVAAGHRVVLWSSAFYHSKKRHRSHHAERITVSDHLEIYLIPSPGYGRNIGLGRLWDHVVLARNIKKLLRTERIPPDVGFIGYPPIESSAVMAQWLSEHGVPTILDIKDQWPPIFLDPLPKVLKPVGRVVLAPYVYLARRSMRGVTGMSAMAESFLQWGLDYAGRDRNPNDKVFPLTSPQSHCSDAELKAARDWWDSLGIKQNSHVTRIIFIGSHMAVFDFEPIRFAAAAFAHRFSPVEFVICGDGGSSVELREMMKSLSNVHFPGWVDRSKVEALAERSQAALVPYQNIDCYIRSLPNKVIDSLALGLPILSPLQGEVANLISTHEVGLRYGTDTGKSLVDCIKMLIDDTELQHRLSQNARRRFEEEFTYGKVYGGLVQHLEHLASLKL